MGLEGVRMIPEVSVDDVQRRLAAGDEKLVLVDVRKHDELTIAAIDGARHIPMADIPTRTQEFDDEHEYVFFCHHGKRSYNVAAFLKEQGVANVASMRGGIDAWSQQVDPEVPRY